MRGIVDEILLVDDATILRAMQLLLNHAGLIVEPAGAVGVAAAMAYRSNFEGQVIATPLCGANVTPEQFKTWFAAPAMRQPL